MERELLSPARKALAINLDNRIYGSFAEIGAGQEVARHFFKAGGASGTVAKTISAYDMKYSDKVYGVSPNGRYVCEERLYQMLDAEFSELLQTLEKPEKEPKLYFTYANTVTTINFHKTNESHGWMGVRFYTEGCREYNEVILHVKMLESDAYHQQVSLGILGVNLIYACYYLNHDANLFINSLLDNTDTRKIEIDMLNMDGPCFSHIDNRLLSVLLVKNEITKVAFFNRDGRVVEPKNLLYKKNLLVLRGTFRPITYVGVDMLKTGMNQFKKDIDYHKENGIVLCELSLQNLLADGEFDEDDFLDRVDLLCGMGQNVMVSNFKEHFRLIYYLNGIKVGNIGFIVGAPNLEKVYDKKYYTHLDGGVLEGFGRLFLNNVIVYVYPGIDPVNNELVTLKTLEVPKEIEYLVKHLIVNNKIKDLTTANEKNLKITSSEVLNLIKSKNEKWESMVPNSISKHIKEKNLFGYTK